MRDSPLSKAKDAPRIGLPYRTAGEERAKDKAEIAPYVNAIEEAGGEPELISLFLTPEELGKVASRLDGLLLPGSSADVDPARYGEVARPETTEPDRQREQTDTALLDWAFENGKPLLTICYGTQLLNVHCGGTLVQDIRNGLRSSLVHEWGGKGIPEPYHPVRLIPGSRVAGLAETSETVVNSSHHQSIRRPGEGLRVTAKCPDGVIEAVEMADSRQWVVGVQWHPERQQQRRSDDDADSGVRLARWLFRDLVRAARRGSGARSAAGGTATITHPSEDR